MQPCATKSIPDAVREICLSFPQAQELISHGKPNFKVAGKSFAMFCINPLLGERPLEVRALLVQRCSQLPETSEGEQFGNPVWKAGKKTFLCILHHGGRLHLQFWVGVEQQSLLVSDPRYSIPSYIGHNGWIELDIEQSIDWSEVDSLLNTTYRHFALQRMLKALDGGDANEVGAS